MRRDPGSCNRARQLALGALVDHGCTNLEARVGAHVASFGSVCWQTDGVIREILERDYGRTYHRESIARARRTLTKAKFMRANRLLPGQRVQGMRHGSTHGTTAKWFSWSCLKLKNPHSRRERAIQQQQEAAERHRAAQKQREMSEPQYSALTTIVNPPAPPDAELAKVLAEFEAIQARRMAANHVKQGVEIAEKAAIEAKDRGPP